MNWNDLIAETVELRHQLHRIPELRWQEQKTSALLVRQLEAAGIAWRGCAKTGIVAHLAQEAPGAHLGFRADLDGLPITENSKQLWASEHGGCMHGCGHDGHMATLIGLARWLKMHEQQLLGPVTLIFQPAEEGGYGARAMIEDGALEGVEQLFGWHNWPAIPFGHAICPEGVVMAANGNFSILLHGQGGHASQPELCRDPLLAGGALVLNLQQIVSRRLRPQDSAVVSVTSFDGPGGETTIPETATIRGSIRVGDDRTIAAIARQIQEIAAATGSAYGVTAEVSVSPRYPATVNHPDAARVMGSALNQVFGDNWVSHDTPIPLMASEDFSYYLREVPGAFALVGGGTATGEIVPCHNNKYDFNDDLIAPMIRVLSRIATFTC